jgi:hypothetical protein
MTDRWYTVGYYDHDTDDWYFNGEYDTHAAAVACARKTATQKGRRARVTEHPTGRVEYFDASSETHL